MRKFIRSLVIKIKLMYYTFVDYFDDDLDVDLDLPLAAIQRQHHNSKLSIGVRKLVRRLREMNPLERTEHENLLGMEPYKKSAREKMEELRIQDRVYKNPTLKSEDDLVHTVVKKAPIYEKEVLISKLRKEITACLRASQADPTNPTHTKEAKALKAKLRLLRAEIERMKSNG